jgi:SOS-response transcriptional repressor LexA
VLEAALPDCAPRNVGVILVDSESGRGWLKMRREFADIAEAEDAEVFDTIESDLREHMREQGAAATLQWMQDTLSNVLRISDSREVKAESFTRALERLYDENVERVHVREFETHLPLYTLRAAAGHLSDEMAVDPEDWIPAPEDVKLDRNLFVAHVTGHSMEPRIPDGSLNLFRFNPVGSRQGKIVLVERFGAFDDTARFSVKRYTSEKAREGDSWRHTRIRLEPLNPDYEPWDVDPEGFAVIAEWLRVIE